MSRLAAVLGSRWVTLRSPDRRKAGTLATLDLAVEASGAYLASGLIAITLLLVGFGLLSVYSASSYTAQSEGLPDSYYLVQQSARALVGIAALLAASFVDYRVYRHLAWPLLAATAALLIIVILPGTEAIAPRINGARRWLMLGVTIQPSELAKIAIVIWTAALAVKKQDRLRSLRYGLVPFLLVIGTVCLLILLEPHLSGAMLVGALAFIVLFAAGGRLGHFLFLAMLGLPVLWDQVANTGYRMNRMLAFMKPGMGADDIGYQLNQSLIAIGSGGPFGVGFGESRQKLLYLPEPQNDFIFSIIAEEWGLIGSVFLIGLFLAWTVIGIRIAGSAPDLFGRLLAVGLTAIVTVGAFTHIGVTLGVLPTTGVNLPFISAGGTGLVLALGVTGILVNIAKQRRC
ncbi:MAG: putative peptidoglycan glycosyltransferase FtsW [Gemmatimonadota bacterium]